MKTFSQVVLSRIVAFTTIAYDGGRKLNDTIPSYTTGIKLVFIKLKLVSYLCDFYWGIKTQWSFCCQQQLWFQKQFSLLCPVRWFSRHRIDVTQKCLGMKKNGTGEAWVSWYKIEKCYLIKLYSSFSCSVLTTLKKTNDNSKSIDT